MDNLNDHDPITVIEFCAGYGGLGLGIKGVLGERMRLIGLCELEGFAQANLISKMEAGLMAQVPIWSNLLTFPYRKFRGLVDIAAAGIPCQPHSLAGKRSGGGDERFLFDDWLCGLEQMQPRAIFIENVEGFLSSKMPDGTLCVEWTIKRLEAMGYQSATGIFSAREVGAPHQRKRVFILAHRNDSRLEGWYGAILPECPSERTAWPSRPSEPQYAFEPPRVVGNPDCLDRRTSSSGWINDAEAGSAGEGGSEWQIESSLGRNFNESTRGLDYAELSDADSAMREDDASSFNGTVADTIHNGCDNADSRSIEHGVKGSLGEETAQQTRRDRIYCSEHGQTFGNGQLHPDLYITCDNRTDELRLLGNGVVPATATLAFQTLLAELLNTQPNL